MYIILGLLKYEKNIKLLILCIVMGGMARIRSAIRDFQKKIYIDVLLRCSAKEKGYMIG